MDEGRELWLAKCREYPGNDEAQSERKWDEDCAEPKAVGAGTIYHIAREADPLLKGFQRNKDGKIRSNGFNVRLALEKLGIGLSYNSFADRTLVTGLEGHGPLLQDPGVISLYLQVEATFGFRPAKDFFWMVVQEEARTHSFHPVEDYLNGLTWDGKKRLDSWLVDFGGAENTPYVRAVGRLALIAAVRRIRKPGVLPILTPTTPIQR